MLALLGQVPSAFAQKPVPVDLELAFVVDASASIDEDETRLQRSGYAGAIRHPKVLQAIDGGLLRSVAVAYVEFAAAGCVRMSVPWTRVHDEASAAAFGDEILRQDRLFCPGGNAIGEAVALAFQSIDSNGFDGTRRVIDVSGDGPNTFDPPVEAVRDIAVAAGVTINGLVIDRPTFPALDEYYKQYISGGPGSFVIKAESRQTFAAAILKKMILEIASMRGPTQSATTESAAR